MSTFYLPMLRMGAIMIVSGALYACDNPAPGEGPGRQMGSHPSPEVLPAREAINSPNPLHIDPGTMTEAEIAKVLPAGARCTFTYTAESPAVLAGFPADPAAGSPGVSRGEQDADDRPMARGVIKIHGKLVEVTAPEERSLQDLRDGAEFMADGLHVTISTDFEKGDLPSESEERTPANLELELQLEQTYLFGYRGWYRCADG